MKKFLLTMVIALTLTLTGCVPEVEEVIDLEPDTIIEYDIHAFETAIVEMLDQSKTGVLGVRATSTISGGTGSGVVYKKEGETTYYLVTNEHVLVHQDETTFEYFVADIITVVYEKNGILIEIPSEDVEVIGYDNKTDLAVLKFTSDEDFSVIPFADSSEIELGEFVYAIGNPLGFEYYGTITSGIISGLARTVNDGVFDTALLQHDAAISPGNSGGALLNIYGELIGINNMKIVQDNVQNIGFAIPSNTVAQIIADLEDNGVVDNPDIDVSTSTCGADNGVCVTAQAGILEQVKTGILGVVAQSDIYSESGSGVVYKKQGENTFYLVTNDHVVVHQLSSTGHYFVANTIVITYEKDGVILEIPSENIELLGYDHTTDLAVLRFVSDEDFTVIPFGNSNNIELGQFVYAVGNPLGFEYFGTITSGMISGLARYVNSGDFDATLLQHDAIINEGNSGGALLNSAGELIGINKMEIVQANVSNIAFTIPSNTVARITADLEDDGVIQRPYLGISTYAQINACGLDYGVCVTVQAGGAADNAGLEDNDVIIGYKILGFDEFQEIINFNDLREAILNSSVGDTIYIKYVREGIIKESIATELGVHPDDE